jgi:hypothetical protein
MGRRCSCRCGSVNDVDRMSIWRKREQAGGVGGMGHCHPVGQESVVRESGVVMPFRCWSSGPQRFPTHRIKNT